MIEKFYNLLNEEELDYLNLVINNKDEWKYRTEYKNPKQYFDSIVVEKNNLKNYFNIITNNGEFNIIETGLNVITFDTQLENSTHFDESDISYATYLNEDFQGGEFVYYDENNIATIIKPIQGLTIKIENKTIHKVNKIHKGIRFSLYSFLQKKQKNIKTLL